MKGDDTHNKRMQSDRSTRYAREPAADAKRYLAGKIGAGIK